MGILFILVMLLIPYMWGCLLSSILKDDKEASNTVVYVRGIVLIFVLTLPVVLATLKLNLSFSVFS